jgi:hypothetical protein
MFLADVIGNFILGWIKNGQMQAWIRLLMSLSGTAFVSFFGVFGLTIVSLYPTLGPVGALIIGLGAASLAMALSVLFLWRNSKLTKMIPIAVAGDIEAAYQETLEKQGFVISREKK